MNRPSIQVRIVTLQTRAREEMQDITPEVDKAVRDSGIRNGVAMVYVPHTTAGVTINENADPSVRADILMSLRAQVPDSLPYTHAEGNSPAHVKASLLGSSVHVLIIDGRPALGTWQGVFFCEFDGPRTRRIRIACRE